MLSDGTAAALGHGDGREEERKAPVRDGGEETVEEIDFDSRQTARIFDLMKEKKTKYSSIPGFPLFYTPPFQNN